jgi:hypothetical protein
MKDEIRQRTKRRNRRKEICSKSLFLKSARFCLFHSGVQKEEDGPRNAHSQWGVILGLKQKFARHQIAVNKSHTGLFACILPVFCSVNFFFTVHRYFFIILDNSHQTTISRQGDQ